MACNCGDSVDVHLKKRNTRLARAIILGQPSQFRALVETEQLETGRGKPRACSMFATFCPFCGTKYGEA